MTSIFKSNKFFRIIKHFVLCIPLMVVLGTSIYAIVNPNAQESYDGANEYRYDEITNLSGLVPGNTYRLKNGTKIDNSFALGSNNGLNVSNIYIFSSDSQYILTANLIGVYSSANSSSLNYAFYHDDTLLTSNIQFDIEFTYLGNNLNTARPNMVTNISNGLYSVTLEYYSSLNNAFSFGMHQFTQFGFNKFDFVGLFDGIFTDNVHNVYTDFINSYINYYLMIECVYFVPWVIHIFIHFAYDLGDYFTSSFRRNKEDD